MLAGACQRPSKMVHSRRNFEHCTCNLGASLYGAQQSGCELLSVMTVEAATHRQQSRDPCTSSLLFGTQGVSGGNDCIVMVGSEPSVTCPPPPYTQTVSRKQYAEQRPTNLAEAQEPRLENAEERWSMRKPRGEANLEHQGVDSATVNPSARSPRRRPMHVQAHTISPYPARWEASGQPSATRRSTGTGCLQ